MTIAGFFPGLEAIFATTTLMAEEPLSAASAAMNAYADGDEAAFATVYDELAPRLIGYVQRKTRSLEAAEDVVQHVFLNMHRARSRFTPGSRVEPWAYSIARRLTIDWARARSPHQLVDDVETLAGASSAPSPENLTHASELEAALRTELADVPEHLREAFLLVRVEQLSIEDASAILGTSASATKVHVHRAGLRLRPRLAAFLSRGDE